MHISRGLLLLVCCFSGWLGAQEPSAPGERLWKAGAASAKITPQKPLWMSGYASRTKPSEGVAQDLFAKALAVEDGAGERMVFLTMDLIAIPGGLRRSVEEVLEQKHGLSPGRLMMNCSHTHCGPEFRVGTSLYLELMDHGGADSVEYGSWLASELVRIAGEALLTLQPAKLSVTHARCGFAMNRRLPTRLGFKNSPYPDGPVSHDVPVLEVLAADNRLLAVMFGYACHNTTLSFQQFCGDYAGYAQEYLEKAHPGAVALFVLGCGGDQNPYPRGTLELAQQHGRSLANAVETGLMVVTKQPVTGGVTAALEKIDLPFAPPPTVEELKVKATSSDKWQAGHAKMLLERLESGRDLPKTYPYPIQVIRFGKAFTMVALGGEVVVDYALRIQQELKQPMTWVAGYSNNVMGYIPSTRVLKEGGYEAGGAVLFTANPAPWTADVEELIVGKVIEMHRQLAQ